MFSGVVNIGRPSLLLKGDVFLTILDFRTESNYHLFGIIVVVLVIIVLGK